MNATQAQKDNADHLVLILADQAKVYKQGAAAFMKARPDYYRELTSGKGCALANAFREWLAERPPTQTAPSTPWPAHTHKSIQKAL